MNARCSFASHSCTLTVAPQFSTGRFLVTSCVVLRTLVVSLPNHLCNPISYVLRSSAGCMKGDNIPSQHRSEGRWHSHRGAKILSVLPQHEARHRGRRALRVLRRVPPSAACPADVTTDRRLRPQLGAARARPLWRRARPPGGQSACASLPSRFVENSLQGRLIHFLSGIVSRVPRADSSTLRTAHTSSMPRPLTRASVSSDTPTSAPRPRPHRTPSLFLSRP
jgi:hypothetical protein